MAKAASADAVAADMSPPDFRYAVQQVRGAIQTKKNKISGVNGEIADVYAKIESRKVNRKAVKIFAALDVLDQADRMDIFRSLNGMIDAAGWGEEDADLVDQAQDNVVHLRVGTQSGGEDDGDGELDEALGDGQGDEIDAVADEVAKPDTTRSKQNATAKAAADEKKAKLEAAAKGEPYTGDNNDLAGE